MLLVLLWWVLLCAGLVSPVDARADWEAAPESRWHLYTTYANFVDQQNMMAWRGYNRYWATVGINAPLFGDNDIPYHPQFVMHLSGNDSMHVNDGGGVFTETLDTRWGFDAQFAVPQWWGLRFSIGIQHESGHTVDGTDDPQLNQLDLGDNTFRLQAYKDFSDLVRVGLLVVPVINSIPDNFPARAYGLADYFPLGPSDGTHRFKPYVSGSIGSTISSDLLATCQVQVGVAVGNHFMDHHSQELRIGGGFYSGSDPRAKYAQYDFLRTTFWYMGMMLNL